MSVSDPASGANFSEIVSTHISLDWTVDFHSEIISGYAEHSLRALRDGVDKVRQAMNMKEMKSF